MDAKVVLKHALPRRQPTESAERSADRSHDSAVAFTAPPADAALHLWAAGHERGATSDRLDLAVFKRTLCAADLKRLGPYVAKDVFEADDSPLLKTPDKRQNWKTNKTDFASGYPCKYAEPAGAAHRGAMTRPGRAAETECYVDI